jgi:hypothetical protein
MVERAPIKEIFSAPNIRAEKEGFTRVARQCDIDESVLLYTAEYEGKMVTLTDEVWGQLEDTNSYTIDPNEHDVAAEHALADGKDYHAVADAMYAGLMAGKPIDAPIIMKQGEMYYLISGNSRLMAARAYGVMPPVWMFEVEPANE